jgi:beta-xylosidase
MKNTNKVVLLSIIGFLLMGSYLTLATAQEPPVETAVSQNQYQGQIAGNETNQFMFRNRFQFQLRVNQSVNLDMDVDVDGIGDREFQLEVNTQENAELTIKINASDESIGLEEGKQVQARNQNRYQYREQFRVNLTCDEPVEAKLSLKTGDSEAQWAYYDENQADWVTVPSTYENGVLSAETDHFSVWTVLTLEDSIPSYTLIGFVTIGSIVGLLFIIKKKK